MTIQTYTTVNSSSKMTVNLNSVSHVIEHVKNTIKLNAPIPQDTCWIHFQSGKSVHVLSSYDDVNNDLQQFYNSSRQAM